MRIQGRNLPLCSYITNEKVFFPNYRGVIVVYLKDNKSDVLINYHSFCRFVLATLRDRSSCRNELPDYQNFINNMREVAEDNLFNIVTVTEHSNRVNREVVNNDGAKSIVYRNFDNDDVSFNIWNRINEEIQDIKANAPSPAISTFIINGQTPADISASPNNTFIASIIPENEQLVRGLIDDDGNYWFSFTDFNRLFNIQATNIVANKANVEDFGIYDKSLYCNCNEIRNSIMNLNATVEQKNSYLREFEIHDYICEENEEEPCSDTSIHQEEINVPTIDNLTYSEEETEENNTISRRRGWRQIAPNSSVTRPNFEAIRIINDQMNDVNVEDFNDIESQRTTPKTTNSKMTFRKLVKKGMFSLLPNNERVKCNTSISPLAHNRLKHISTFEGLTNGEILNKMINKIFVDEYQKLLLSFGCNDDNANVIINKQDAEYLGISIEDDVVQKNTTQESKQKCETGSIDLEWVNQDQVNNPLETKETDSVSEKPKSDNNKQSGKHSMYIPVEGGKTTKVNDFYPKKKRLNMSEVAKVLGITLSRVSTLIDRGVIPAKRSGRKIQIKSNIVDYVLKNGITREQIINREPIQVEVHSHETDPSEIDRSTSYRTVSDTAALLGVPNSVIYNNISRGKIYSVKMNGRHYIPVTVVNNLIENGIDYHPLVHSTSMIHTAHDVSVNTESSNVNESVQQVTEEQIHAQEEEFNELTENHNIEYDSLTAFVLNRRILSSSRPRIYETAYESSMDEIYRAVTSNGYVYENSYDSTKAIFNEHYNLSVIDYTSIKVSNNDSITFVLLSDNDPVSHGIAGTMPFDYILVDLRGFIESIFDRNRCGEGYVNNKSFRALNVVPVIRAKFSTGRRFQLRRLVNFNDLRNLFNTYRRFIFDTTLMRYDNFNKLEKVMMFELDEYIRRNMNILRFKRQIIDYINDAHNFVKNLHETGVVDNMTRHLFTNMTVPELLNSTVVAEFVYGTIILAECFRDIVLRSREARVEYGMRSIAAVAGTPSNTALLRQMWEYINQSSFYGNVIPEPYKQCAQLMHERYVNIVDSYNEVVDNRIEIF